MTRREEIYTVLLITQLCVQNTIFKKRADITHPFFFEGTLYRVAIGNTTTRSDTKYPNTVHYQ